MIAFIVGGVLAVVFVCTAARGIEREKAKSQSDPAAVLDAAFAGDSTVTFKVTPATLEFDTVVKGAGDRGYDLTHQVTEDTAWGAIHSLVFTRRAP